jgi:hypothetical protein
MTRLGWFRVSLVAIAGAAAFAAYSLVELGHIYYFSQGPLFWISIWHALFVTLVAPFLFVTALTLLAMTVVSFKTTPEGGFIVKQSSLYYRLMSLFFRDKWRDCRDGCSMFALTLQAIYVVFGCLLLLMMASLTLQDVVTGQIFTGVNVSSDARAPGSAEWWLETARFVATMAGFAISLVLLIAAPQYLFRRLVKLLKARTCPVVIHR